MWSFFSKDPTKDLVNFDVQEQIALPAELQEKTIWSLNNAKRKNATGQPTQSGEPLLYSVFSHHVKPGTEQNTPAAKNAFKRMKMLRHPNILQFEDGIESEKGVFIVTERVQPLYSYLNASTDSESQKANEISWGLYQIATALSFLNNDCKISHNNVCIASVVVNRAGEWKLTGFEYAHPIDDNQNVIAKNLRSLDVYIPSAAPPSGPKNANPFEAVSSSDSWGLGCLIWEIFNTILTNKVSLDVPGSAMPKRLVSAYQALLSPNVNKRLTTTKFLAHCRQENGFLNNHFVDTLLFLDQLQIKDNVEKTKFFTELTQKLDDFPGQLCIYKILPQLLNAFEFGNAGSSVLAPLFKLGKILDEAEYQKKIIPVVVKLFSSTDRTTRMRLLQQLDLFIEHLSASIINDQIFPHLCQGFSDTHPAIREYTIRAIVLIAPKLSYNNMNVELMKYFARLQGTDDQGMIRTNTTVCIGKIAPYINPQLRQRILLSAFPKAMRDPFPLARLSGIIALANTDRFYTLRDISSKVLPSICMLFIDPEKDVRDEAFKAAKLFMGKLEKVSEQPELALDMEKDVMSCNLDVKNETTWTSWAMTSLSAKMTGYKNKNQQPSVALNSQPLAAPPSLSKSSPETSPAKTGGLESSASKSSVSKAAATASKPLEDHIDLDEFTHGTSISDTLSATAASKSNSATIAGASNSALSTGASSWNAEESDDWKDLEDEDDEQLEPLEVAPAHTQSQAHSNNSAQKVVTKPTSTYFAQKSVPTISNGSSSKTTNSGGNNDWSSWSNSFEDGKSEDNDHDDALFSYKPTKPVAPAPTLSSQTSNSSASLGKATLGAASLSLAAKKSEPHQPPQTTSKDSGWSSEWNDVVKETTPAPKEVRPRASKPLKLGQRKPDF